MKKVPELKPVKEKKSIKKISEPAGALYVYSMQGEQKGEITIPDKVRELFGKKVSPRLMALYVRYFLAGTRQGTHSTKTRSEVAGTTRKVYRQKGTGRARHGSRKGPVFVGGGVTFGPKPRDYHIDLNQKQKQRALVMALSSRMTSKEMFIIDEANTKKTKDVSLFLKKMQLETKKTLLMIISQKTSPEFKRTLRNIPNLTSRQPHTLNAYAVLQASALLFTKAGFEELTSYLEVQNI